MQRVSSVAQIGFALVFAALGGCSGTSEGGRAAIGAGVAIAATGIHRAATGDCWGRCSPGYVCNSESGFCEPGECNPTCPDGYSCTVTPTGTSCQSTPQPAFNPMDGTARIDGIRTEDANSQVSEPPKPATTSITPFRSESGQVQIEKGNPGPKGEATAQSPAGSTGAANAESSRTPSAESTCTSEEDDESCTKGGETPAEKGEKAPTDATAPQD